MNLFFKTERLTLSRDWVRDRDRERVGVLDRDLRLTLGECERALVDTISMSLLSIVNVLYTCVGKIKIFLPFSEFRNLFFVGLEIRPFQVENQMILRGLQLKPQFSVDKLIFYFLVKKLVG